MLSTNVILPNPYGWSYFSNGNKICDWIVILICLIIVSILSSDFTHAFTQCIPGIDYDCGDYADFPDPGLAYPVRKSTVSFTSINIICPIVWLIVFAINVAIINCYHPLFDANKLWKIVLIKTEILVRSLFVSVLFTALTTEILKNSVGRPRPNYLNNDDVNDRSKSFPSGHTSYMFSVFFIFTLYLFHSFYSVRTIIYCQSMDFRSTPSIKTPVGTRKTLENIKNAYNDIIPDRSTDENDFDDQGKMIKILMDGSIVNVLNLDEIMNIFNGDSYFFLPLFVHLKHLQLLSVLIALSPTMFCIYVGCSRITDYKHHYDDVLCGALIGTAFSFLSYIYYRTEFYYGFQYDRNKIFNNIRQKRNSINQ